LTTTIASVHCAVATSLLRADSPQGEREVSRETLGAVVPPRRAYAKDQLSLTILNRTPAMVKSAFLRNLRYTRNIHL